MFMRLISNYLPLFAIKIHYRNFEKHVKPEMLLYPSECGNWHQQVTEDDGNDNIYKKKLYPMRKKDLDTSIADY